MKTAIAVFCKTPGLSQVKTRLGAEIGNSDAEEFYRLSVLAVKEVLGEVVRRQSGFVDVYWAVAEREGITHSMWEAYSRIWTGEGSLGDRIHQVFEQLYEKYDNVIIIGSDSPQLTADYLLKAINKLKEPQLDGVIGPCQDGGFVLFGSKRTIAKSVWTNVTYSRQDTLQQLEHLLKQIKYSYHLMPTMGDVDQYDDLMQLLNDFLRLGVKILPKQKYLYHWMQNILLPKMFRQEA